MTTGAVIVREPFRSERGYVFQTARSLVVQRNCHRFADYPAIIALVDPIVDRSTLRVAVFEGVLDEAGRQEIHGFAVEDPTDGTLEFFHLRTLYREMETKSLAARVVAALVGDRMEVILRRGVADHVLNGIIEAGRTPVVRPRSV